MCPYAPGYYQGLNKAIDHRHLVCRVWTHAHGDEFSDDVFGCCSRGGRDVQQGVAVIVDRGVCASVLLLLSKSELW